MTAQNIDPTNAQQAQFEAEATEIVNEHRSSPAVIAYVAYNEGWGERALADTARVAQNIKNLDPTRLVNPHSGYNCCQSLGNPGNGDIIDWHNYADPASPTPTASRVATLGEFGGVGLRTPGPRVQPERQLPGLRVPAELDRADRPVRRHGCERPVADDRHGPERRDLHRDHRRRG